VQFSHFIDIFLGGIITIAMFAVLFQSKNTAGVINAAGNATKGSLVAAEGQAAA
jgi:hypothetical protein